LDGDLHGEACEALPDATEGLGGVAFTSEMPRGVPEEGTDTLVERAWSQIRSQLEQTGSRKVSVQWVRQLDLIGLRHGTLHLSTRSQRMAQFLQNRYGSTLARAAGRQFGTRIRIRIEVDHSLGGALARLGFKAPSGKKRSPREFLSKSENRVAHSAVLQMARHQEPEWDRLLLVGPTDTGKSHLLRLFAFQRQRYFPRERWLERSALQLFRDYSKATRDGRCASFRGELLTYDGWIVDDLQDLARKLRTQELMIEILEYFRSRGRLAVLAATQLPESSREFLPKLRSIVASGCTASLSRLSQASRIEILQSHAGPGAALDEFCAELGRSTLALHTDLERVREMGRFAAERGRAPKRDEWCARYPDLQPAARPSEPMDRILDRAAAFVGVSRDAIVNGSRHRSAALGRHLAVYVAVEVFHMRRAAIKNWLGKLSPSVIPYVKTKIHALRQRDPRVDGFVRELAEEIQKGQRFLF
jgi:chromosomal replication initiation ATPase DnaA